MNIYNKNNPILQHTGVHPEMRIFCPRSPAGNHGIKRHVRKLTTGIYLIFRGLIFKHNPEK